jgi:Lrp/AsnC family leucine-responsive transcriptional regulator
MMLDALDQRIREILADDARNSLKDLAKQVQLSSPSVSERLRRL